MAFSISILPEFWEFLLMKVYSVTHPGEVFEGGAISSKVFSRERFSKGDLFEGLRYSVPAEIVVAITFTRPNDFANRSIANLEPN